MIVHVPQRPQCRTTGALPRNHEARELDRRPGDGGASVGAGEAQPAIGGEQSRSAGLGDLIVAALERNPLFITATLPLRVFPPLFNRYEGGESFGAHLDNSIRQVPGTPLRVRTDISATLFLSAPEDYEGGELVIDDIYGEHAVKLPAGDMVVYPASSLHHVKPVTRGVRLASFFWVQSMVRDDGHRTLLFDLDMAINKVNQALPNHGGVVELTNCYHNLLRRFAEV